MIKRIGTVVAAIAALSFSTQSMAQAQRCWDVPTVGAARISEFETMMMVSVLRCKAAGMDMRPDLDRFQTVQKVILEKAHVLLRTRYGVGAKETGNNGYDRFVTGVANAYGMGKTETGVCQQIDGLLTALASADTGAEMLAEAVIQMVRDPHLDAERCPGPLAQK